MHKKPTETVSTQLQEQLFDLANDLRELGETSTDVEKATDFYLAEHATLYVRWIGISGNPHPQRYNWEKVIEHNWPLVRDEPFAAEFSYEEHKLAVRRLLEDMWPDMIPTGATSTSLH